MTTSSTPADRGRLETLARVLDRPAGFFGMLALGLAVRLAIAPQVGFYFDLNYFRLWASELAAVGPHHFYSVDRAVDYPPGYLYLLWIVGKISASPGYLLLKLPTILADVGLAWVAGVFASRLAPESLTRRLPLRGLVAAAVLFNPAVIALSAVWGQVDAIPTLIVLASLLLLFTGRRTLARHAGAFALFGAAVAIKPQAGLALPVMLYALYRWYLRGRDRAGLVDGSLSIALLGVCSLLVWVVSGLPFGLGPVDYYHFLSHSASVHPVTSANAFNLWGVIGSWRNDATGFHVLTIAGLPALRVGLLLFAVAIGVVLWQTHRAVERGVDEAQALTLAAATTSLVGYVVLTRMHERYMFFALALFAPLIFAQPLRRVYAALSAGLLVNLWFAFAYYNVQVHMQALKLDPLYGWVFGGFAFDTWQKRLISLAITSLALLVVWRGFRWLPRGAPARAAAATPHAPAAPAAGRSRRPTPTSPAPRWVPWALVGLTSLFGLVVLRAETKPAENLNDSALHLLMVRWASGQIHEGRVPLDGWFPYFALGSSFFHHYQSLPHTLTAYLVRVLGASDWTTYLWIQYLLLALWPISVYLGARLLDWDRWTSGSAAAISPMLVSTPGYGYEQGSYTWQGYGVYSQLFGMWLLPIAWGLTWRAVSRGRQYAAAAVALALTIACHFITGYLAILTVGVWVIVLGRSDLLRRVGRAALVTCGSVAIAAWVVVPLVGDTKWTAESEYYVGTIFNDSYGARKILGWLFTGKLFDVGRFPIVTLLFFGGVVLCVARVRQEVRARALLGAFTLSLLLFFGRRTWGRLIDVFPGFGNVQIHRFVMGVDLAAIMIAGVALGWLLRRAWALALARMPRSYAVAAGIGSIVLAVVVLSPAWIERAHYNERGADLISSQRAYDATDGRDLDRLISYVQSRHDGRVYAGLRANWGADYRIGSVPVHAWLADRSVDAIGFVFRAITSLSTDVEAAFEESNPAQYQMLNIRYLILPADRKPPVPAKLIMSSGRHRLYEVKTSGYFQVVDRAPAVKANRTNIEQATRAFRESNLALRGIYPGVAFAGGTAPPPTFTGANPPPGSAGKVISQSNTLQDGVFTATVAANRPAVALLKATYDPRWTVTVDGLPAKPSMMAPSFVGVEVPVGRHVVRFRYEPYSHYTLLLTIGALAFLGLILVPRRAALRRRLVSSRSARSEASAAS